MELVQVYLRRISRKPKRHRPTYEEASLGMAPMSRREILDSGYRITSWGERSDELHAYDIGGYRQREVSEAIDSAAIAIREARAIITQREEINSRLEDEVKKLEARAEEKKAELEAMTSKMKANTKYIIWGVGILSCVITVCLSVF